MPQDVDDERSPSPGPVVADAPVELRSTHLLLVAANDPRVESFGVDRSRPVHRSLLPENLGPTQRSAIVPARLVKCQRIEILCEMCYNVNIRIGPAMAVWRASNHS